MLKLARINSAIAKNVYFKVTREPIMNSKKQSASARHILVKTESEAEKIKQLIAKGADFGVMARKHSSCSSAKRGGNLGEFRPGQMVKAFDNVVFKLPLHVVHGPIKTQFGYHLIETIYRD